MKTKRTTIDRRALALSDALIVIATIALVGTIMLPMFARPSRCSGRISCVNNLKQVGLAFRIFANDNDDMLPMAIREADGGAKESVERGDVFRVYQVMSNELLFPVTVHCSTDDRIAAADFSRFGNLNVSYFIGIDAIDVKPNMVLAGDRNLSIDGRLLTGVQNLSTNRHPTWTEAMHRNAGNIALADGSVQQVTTSILNQHLAVSDDDTNRIAFPQ